MQKYFNQDQNIPGAAPGVEHNEIHNLTGGNGDVSITCFDYCLGQFLFHEIDNLKEFLDSHRPEWTTVRWISVCGLSDMNAMHSLATKYDLHPLAVEDIFQKTQRPKVEAYGGEESEFKARLFIVTHIVRLIDGRLFNEQISIFLGHKTVLTFQESCNFEWEPIRQRIKTKGSRLRSNDAGFLVYSLLDAVVDICFPVLETYSDTTEELESHILQQSTPGLINDIHQLKRDLLKLRWVIWPMREVVSTLQRDPHECISETTHIYLRDLYDHVVQIIDLIETYREITSDLTDTYISSVSNRMNEVMKVLTIIGTIFIPLTFLAGVYGMNFHYFPELNEIWAYPAFWAICIFTAVIMLWLFRRRKWL